MITVEHLVKQYGDFRAVDDLSFTVEKGEILGFLGPNGAGKSTTMNMITGYNSATEGDVTINGFNIYDEPEKAKRCIGYLPEIPPVYPDMRVKEYLRFCTELKEIPKKDREAEVKRVMDLLHVTHMQNKMIKHLSKGYRQRAGIAQALCGAPEILILDEPTVGLDPKQTVEIRELIRRLSSEHTVIFSSHILSEVQQACTRVLILDEGRLVTDYDAGKPEGSTLCLRLSVAGEPEKVLRQIRHLDGFADTEQLPSAETGITEARVKLERGTESGAALDRAFRTLADSGLPVRMMKEEKEDLEEIFLRSISQ